MDDEVTLKLKLLSGKPLQIDRYKLTPLKLKDICDIGYENYLRAITFLSADISSFLNSENLSDEEKKQVENFSVYDIVIIRGGDLFEEFDKSLKRICKDKIKFDDARLVYTSKNGVIDRDNFKELQEAIKYQNMLKSAEPEEKFNPKDEAAARIIEKIKKNRQKVAEAKRNSSKDKQIDLADVISAVSAKSHSINKFNVWNLTIYQLYDEFRRLRNIDEYYLAIDALQKGAKDIEIHHWAERINDN